MKSLSKSLSRIFGVFFFFASSICSFAQTAEIQWKETSLTFEESAGTVDITLVRSGNLTGLASVFYQTVAGTATSGFDYQSISNRQALFTTGKEEITISIRINQDFLEEGPETFLLQLFNPNTGTIIVTYQNRSKFSLLFPNPFYILRYRVFNKNTFFLVLCHVCIILRSFYG